jgi:hypothetical protein
VGMIILDGLRIAWRRGISSRDVGAHFDTRCDS